MEFSNSHSARFVFLDAEIVFTATKMPRLIIVLILVFMAPIIEAVKPNDPDFNAWKQKHGKKYKDDDEENRRFEIYQKNKKDIEAHNELHKQKKKTYSKEVNMFADLTTEEFIASYTGMANLPRPPPRSKRAAGSAYVQLSTRDLPPSVNWTAAGAVTPVKSQSPCGTCGVFSAVGALEALNFKKNGKLVPLSEQNIGACAVAGYKCCGSCGMWYWTAWEYVQKVGGIFTSAAYPYKPVYNQAFGTCPVFQSGAANTASNLVADIKYIEDEAGLQDAVANLGPVSVAIDASGLQFYLDGTLEAADCVSMNHAVLVTGYDTDDNGDYYIIKNSWGPGWGNYGYCRLPRNADNACGIVDYATIPV